MTTPDPNVTFVPNPEDYRLPANIDWSPMCPNAAIGSPPTLTDVQAQLQENQSAKAEGRSADTLAIRCSFCQNYHVEVQPSVNSLTGGEASTTIEDTTPPNSPPPVEGPAIDHAGSASVEYEPGAEVTTNDNSETNTSS